MRVLIMHCAWNTPAADVVPVRHGRWIKRGYVCDCNDCKKKYWSQEVPDDE